MDESKAPIPPSLNTAHATFPTTAIRSHMRYLKRFHRLFALLAYCLLAAPVFAQDGAIVLPGEFTLATPESSQRIIINQVDGDTFRGQVTGAIAWSTDR